LRFHQSPHYLLANEASLALLAGVTMVVVYFRILYRLLIDDPSSS
jgi:hypothetical protein